MESKEWLSYGEVCMHKSQVAYQAGDHLDFCSMEYFYSPLDGMLVHCRVTPSTKFASAHLYTSVVRGTVRVKCLNCPRTQCNVHARAQTRTTQSPVERTNHTLYMYFRCQRNGYIKVVFNVRKYPYSGFLMF